MNRNSSITELKNKSAEVWDIIVIGGGATGLGVALDAVSRGYKVLLLEQSDFAKGTSSRSTKLVHGGVRYLAQGDLMLVTEALRERGMMMKNAPRLTSNQEFVIPVYSYWDVILYTVGLKFYDLLSGRQSIGRSCFINRKATLQRLPTLKSESLKGGIVYHDGQFDDARMALALAKTCVERGGLVLNYFEVTSLQKDKVGKITGVTAKDIDTGNVYNINTKLVINATGVFTDHIIKMDNPDALPSIRPSQGVHIVLPKSFLKSSSAIMIPKTDDGRVLFAIPWYDEVIVGTTDTPIDLITLEPKALNSEVNFILHTAGKYLSNPPRREDVKSVFAGLRPLAANPSNPASTKEISRRHKIIIVTSGLVSVFGGKWTTYRLMAEETINRAIKAGFLEKRKCQTKVLRVTSEAEIGEPGRLEIYGSGSADIQKIIDENPEMGSRVDERLPYTKAEITWICRNEMPFTLEDILARRTRALLLDAQASADMAVETVAIMGTELGFGINWQKAQINAYRQLVMNYQ